MKKLPKTTVGACEAAQSALEDAISEARDYYEGRSEKWQESDKGNSYLAWIEGLEELMGRLEELQAEPVE